MLAPARWWHASSVHLLRKNDGMGAMLISTDVALETITLKLQGIDTQLKTQNERLGEVLRGQAEMETRIKNVISNCQLNQTEAMNERLGEVLRGQAEMETRIKNAISSCQHDQTKAMNERLGEVLRGQAEMETRIQEAISSCQHNQTEATNEGFQEVNGTLYQILEEKRDDNTMSTKEQANDEIRDELAQMSIKLSGEIEQIKSNYVALSQHVATLDNALVKELKAKQRERESMDKAQARFAVGLGFLTLSLCSLAAFDWITRNSGTPL